jgi:hypothetical protein
LRNEQFNCKTTDPVISPIMNHSDIPRPFEEWRTGKFDRAEDAAYTFGYHLMQHCRAEALKNVETAEVPKSAEEYREQIAAAVDRALHNVMDLLEGFWVTQAGSSHQVAYTLSVRVSDMRRKPIERIDISPGLLDLSIGYWKWKDGEFR